MKTVTLTANQELIDWIAKLDDKEVLADLLETKRRATFNFDEAFKKGIPLEEARQRSLAKIREYWKK